MPPFAPHYTITPPLLANIKRITILVHELNQQVYPEVVLVRLQAEARAISTYASTSIEGNPLPLTEVKRLLREHPTHARQSETEVLNYNRVLGLLNERLRAGQGEITAELLHQIQAGVMAELLPAHQLGQWRREPVVVYEPRSREVVYLPPNHEDVPALMSQLVAFGQTNMGVLDPLILAGLFHKQMVVIHPFVDGNGRTTRLATKLLLAGLGLNTFHLFSFENYYNHNVTRYFQHVGLFGDYYELVSQLDFTPWLVYFAEGILDELLRVQKQLEEGQQAQNKLAEQAALYTVSSPSPANTLQAHHHQILAYIDQHGFITDQTYAALTTRAKATRTLDFKKLMALGLLERHGRGRGTHYRRKASS